MTIRSYICAALTLQPNMPNRTKYRSITKTMSCSHLLWKGEVGWVINSRHNIHWHGCCKLMVQSRKKLIYQ